MPRRAKLQKIEALCERLGSLYSVTVELQRDNLNIAQVRVLLVAVIDSFPCTRARPSEHANIIPQPTFESGLLKILEDNVTDLSDEEVSSVQNMKVMGEDFSIIPKACNISFADRALKVQLRVQQKYIDHSSILPTYAYLQLM